MKILHRRSHGLNFCPRESVGEDSSPTLSWAHFFDTWLMASFVGLVRASAKILCPRPHGLVAPPSPSVCVCAIVCVYVCLCLCVLMCVFEVYLMYMLREFVTGLVQLYGKLMLGASVE